MKEEQLYCPICGHEINHLLNNDCETYICDGGDFWSYTYKKLTSKELENLAFYLKHTNAMSKYPANPLYRAVCLYGIKEKLLKIDTPYPVYVCKEMIDSWLPKTFSERVDKILLYLHNQMKYLGQIKQFHYEDLAKIYFVESQPNLSNEAYEQISYINRWLDETNYIKCQPISVDGAGIDLQILPLGLARIDDLQKTQQDSKKIFVAMKFGDETRELREKLKEGIVAAGYEPRIMDEIEHNHQIVPEMLYEIRNSKYVIAELSHHNNGAYYEAGYAYGCGKEVIHICQENELSKGLHFDVAQINMVKYNSINELPEKIKKRIQAIEK